MCVIITRDGGEAVGIFEEDVVVLLWFDRLTV